MNISTIPVPKMRAFADAAVAYCNSDPRFQQEFDHNHLSGAILILLEHYEEELGDEFLGCDDDLNLVRDIMFAFCGMDECVDRPVVHQWVGRKLRVNSKGGVA